MTKFFGLTGLLLCTAMPAFFSALRRTGSVATAASTARDSVSRIAASRAVRASSESPEAGANGLR